MKTQLLSILASATIAVLAFGCGHRPSTGSPLISYFPVQKDPNPNAFMTALWVGRLVVAHGCLRVVNSEGRSVLPVWPANFSLQLNDNTVEVVDGKSQLVVRLGDTIRMGGGEIPDHYITYYVLQPPPENCSGPYWIASHEIYR